jgi:hypothetical protein
MSAGTWEGFSFQRNFKLKPGYRLNGTAYGVTEGGREIFDVTATGQGTHAVHGDWIQCQWHTEGSKKLFGPGGYVVGHCRVAVSYRPPSRVSK